VARSENVYLLPFAVSGQFCLLFSNFLLLCHTPLPEKQSHVTMKQLYMKSFNIKLLNMQPFPLIYFTSNPLPLLPDWLKRQGVITHSVETTPQFPCCITCTLLREYSVMPTLDKSYQIMFFSFGKKCLARVGLFSFHYFFFSLWMFIYIHSWL